MALLFLCGILITGLYVGTPGLYDGYCGDPLLGSTAAHSLFGESVSEQYLFCLCCWSMFVVDTGMWAFTKHNDRRKAALNVHRILMYQVYRKSPMLTALSNWYEGCKYGRSIHNKAVPYWRRVLFWVFHIPAAMLTSLPAVGYVLSQNVPNKMRDCPNFLNIFNPNVPKLRDCPKKPKKPNSGKLSGKG